MTTAEILDAFKQLRVLVAGDVCLDRWCRYDASEAEPSRETGIPRVAVIHTDVTPGAAGTVANNLGALGAARVAVLGVIGRDGFGFELERALEQRGIDTSLLVRSAALPTFTYTKLINARTGVEDLPRIDFIAIEPLLVEVETQLVSTLERVANEFDLILVSDQAETPEGGVVTPRVRQALAAISGRVVWVDSRMRAELFRNVILKPNRDEAERASMRICGRVDFGALRALTAAPVLIVTDGPHGALVISDDGEIAVQAQVAATPVDICGAGDSFSAGAALALQATGSPVEAARFGNLVASITIMKPGTGTASPEEVLAADSRWGGK